MKRQKAKFEGLMQQKQGGHSNQVKIGSPQNRVTNNTEDTNKWVRNLSSIPLSEDQERLLAQGAKVFYQA